uniref:Replication protein A 70 kDa DNA-binding subunit B/D first OB fold domain-containing protein n=1 Tax=Brassica campestris TaxID=3711 RepID=M4DZU6_BRACM
MAPPTTLAVPTTFDDLEGDFCNKEVFVRLIHCWEARNFKKANILMGVELLLIDSKSTTIHGFISTHFLPRFKEDLKPNTIYKLNGFSIRLSKSVYRVSPHKHGISFNNKTTFTPVHEVDYQIDSQHFRIRDLQAFTDIVDKHTDLLGEHFFLSKHYKSLTLMIYLDQIDSQHFNIFNSLTDIIGFLRVINGDNLDTQTPMATAPAPAGERSKDMVFLHVQLEE